MDFFHVLVVSPFSAEEETTCVLKILADRVFPSVFPVFSDEDDMLVSMSKLQLFCRLQCQKGKQQPVNKIVEPPLCKSACLVKPY